MVECASEEEREKGRSYCKREEEEEYRREPGRRRGCLE